MSDQWDRWFDTACGLDAQLQLQIARAEALQAENDRLREALEKIISDQHRAGLGEGEDNEYTAVARAALVKEEGE